MGRAEGFGARLRRARNAKSLTQRKLAELVDTRVMTLSAWENGKTQRPDMETLAAVADELEVSVDWLLLGRDEEGRGPLKPPPAEMDPVLREFLASPLGQDATEEEVEALQTRVHFHTPTVKGYYFALQAFREEER